MESTVDYVDVLSYLLLLSWDGLGRGFQKR